MRVLGMASLRGTVSGGGWTAPGGRLGPCVVPPPPETLRGSRLPDRWGLLAAACVARLGGHFLLCGVAAALWLLYGSQSGRPRWVVGQANMPRRLRSACRGWTVVTVAAWGFGRVVALRWDVTVTVFRPSPRLPGSALPVLPCRSCLPGLAFPIPAIRPPVSGFAVSFGLLGLDPGSAYSASGHVRWRGVNVAIADPRGPTLSGHLDGGPNFWKLGFGTGSDCPISRKLGHGPYFLEVRSVPSRPYFLEVGPWHRFRPPWFPEVGSWLLLPESYVDSKQAPLPRPSPASPASTPASTPASPPRFTVGRGACGGWPARLPVSRKLCDGRWIMEVGASPAGETPTSW